MNYIINDKRIYYNLTFKTKPINYKVRQICNIILIFSIFFLKLLKFYANEK